jgi:hypothetical protein
MGDDFETMTIDGQVYSLMTGTFAEDADGLIKGLSNGAFPASSGLAVPSSMRKMGTKISLCSVNHILGVEAVLDALKVLFVASTGRP